MSAASWLDIELACALPDRQLLLARRVPAGTTLLQALDDSGLLQDFTLLAEARAQGTLAFGVWGKVERSPESRVLRDGDRIEVYRPLTRDPKDARKARAEKVRAEGAGR